MATSTKRITVTDGLIRTSILFEYWDITPVNLSKSPADRSVEYEKDNRVGEWESVKTGKRVVDRDLHARLEELAQK